MVLASFLIFFLGTTVTIGLLALRKSRKSEMDYFIASQSVSPYALALSSCASKFSGFIFVGIMGMAYTMGTAVIWLAAGLFTGALAILFAYPRLQKLNEGGWALSVAELVTLREGEDLLILRRFIGAIIIFFLLFYAAAQLKASGKILEVAVGAPTYVGVLMSMAAILLYCWSGGIRASIWTDTVQFILMMLSFITVMIFVINSEGGVAGLINSFQNTGTNPNHVALFPQNLSVGGMGGLSLFVMGAFLFGTTTLGLPYSTVRVMALKSPEDCKKFIIANYSFEAFFVMLYVMVGLSTRVILSEVANVDAELALFLSAKEILPPLFVGLVLAGMFSATLSTADSQILSCSASVVRDMPKIPKKSLYLAKTATVITTILATVIALYAGDNVFSLVQFASSGLGATIGVLLFLRIFDARIPEWGAVGVGLVGTLSVVLWKVAGLNKYISESAPGIIMALLTFAVIKLLTDYKKKSTT